MGTGTKHHSSTSILIKLIPDEESFLPHGINMQSSKFASMMSCNTSEIGPTDIALQIKYTNISIYM
jgi:hypothetical protein